MKAYSKAGSKQRLLEMMARVNKIALTEGVIPVGTKVPLRGLTIDKLGFELRPETSRRGEQYQAVATEEWFPSPNEGDVSTKMSTDSHLSDWLSNFTQRHGDEGFLVKKDNRKWDVEGNDKFTQWRDQYVQGKAAGMQRDAQRGWSTESVVKEEGGYGDSYHARQDLRQLQRDEDKREFSQIVYLSDSEAIEPLEILNNQGEKAALEYLKQWDNGDSYETKIGSSAGTRDDQFQDGNYLMSWNDRLGYIGLERIEEGIKEADDDSGYSYDRTHPANRPQEPTLLPLESGEQFRYIILRDDYGRYFDIMIPAESYDEYLEKLYRHFGTNSAYQEVKKKEGRNYITADDALMTESNTLKEYDVLDGIDDTSDDGSDPLPTQPNEDDCIISSNGFKLSVSCGGKFIGEFTEDDEAYAAVAQWKKKNNYYPNTWFISDHGNASLVDDNGNEIRESNGVNRPSKDINYKGKTITILHPSGFFEFYSDKLGRFIKSDDLDQIKMIVDREVGGNVNEAQGNLAQIKSSNPALYNQLMVAKKTMKMNDAMANIMGGMSKEEARQLLLKHGMLKEESNDSLSAIDGDYTKGNESYKKAIATDLKNTGHKVNGNEPLSKLQNEDGLFKETYDSIKDYDRAYLDNSVDTEDTNVSKYDGGLDYPAEDALRVDSNLIHQEPINEFDYNQEERDYYNQMELDADMEEFKPLVFNYDQKGNWIPSGHENKGIALRVTYHPIGSSNEKYLVVKTTPDGGVDRIFKTVDTWDQAKEEIKKYL